MVSHLQVLCTVEELTVQHVLVFQRMNAKSMSLGDLLPEKMRKFFFFFLGKRRQYFPTKVHLVKAMVFPVVMYVYKSWPIKKAEHWRIDEFELWCWGRLLKSPLGSREIKPVNSKGSQSWIFTGRTDAEAKTPILWPPGCEELTCWKTLMLGKIEGRRKRGQQRMI